MEAISGEKLPMIAWTPYMKAQPSFEPVNGCGVAAVDVAPLLPATKPKLVVEGGLLCPLSPKA